jgi:peptidoglycan/xylan/chitin deacetylase (PgdA/CDA1 family)
MKGIFTISLDFELHWGVFDKRDRNKREANYKNTLRVVPQMLQMFADYDVHVTWATVGSLFVNNQQEWTQFKPDVEPDYEEERYSAYKWVRQNGMPSEYHWAHFCPEEVAMIQKYRGQELGTHTFSHYYCLEQQSQPQAFDADLKAVQKVAEAKFNGRMRSLVFPRNQANPKYLKECYDNGILAVRSNPSGWFWKPSTNDGAGKLRRLFRTADAYIQVGTIRTTYPLNSIKVVPGEPLQLPASRFLRPWQPKYGFANKMQIKRTCQELRSAAKRGEVYHLWWHPENFGDYPEQNMNNLRIVLQQYKKCKEKYGMMSWNMGEYVDHFMGKNSEVRGAKKAEKIIQ